MLLRRLDLTHLARTHSALARSGLTNGDWVPLGRPRAASSRPHKGAGGKVLLGVAVALGTLGGVGIGYGVFRSSPGIAPESFHGASNSGSEGASGGGSVPSGSGFGGTSGLGGLPSGSGANGAIGGATSGSGSANTSSAASAVDPGLVDINITLSYENEKAEGTGMVLTSNGEVLTNNHVIDGATSISVTDIGNGKTYNANVVGYDRTSDVAVLQLQGASGLRTVSIGNSSSVAVGDAVVGIGNAGGTGGTPSAVSGSITALNQTITASDEGSGTSEQLSGLFETNADIQPGDSGGSLVNAADQVIGMDTAGSDSSSYEGTDTQAYAIPINEAISIAKQIESGNGSQTVHIGATGMLGVEVESSASQTGVGEGFGFGDQGGSSQTGATIANVISGSSAANAGLAAGDTITAIGSTSVDSSNALASAMTLYHPGDKVQVQFVDQSGQTSSASVTLASGPPL